MAKQDTKRMIKYDKWDQEEQQSSKAGELHRPVSGKQQSQCEGRLQSERRDVFHRGQATDDRDNPIHNGGMREGSLEEQFVRDLTAGALFFLKEGDLYIDLKYDTGTMKLSKQKRLLQKYDETLFCHSE